MTSALRTHCQYAQTLWAGALICTLVALAATFVSSHYGGPQLLYALLMGLSLHFLASDPRIRPGVDFCGRTVLRSGVALLGARITFDQVAMLGWQAAVLVALGVASTLCLGWALARRFRRPVEEGLISGGSVGICGASAALAVASVLPPTRENERYTLLVVVGVTLLSTLAMVIYPLLTSALQWSALDSGVFLGATIHDVAQVVAAASLLASPGNTQVVDTATVVKLFRVLLLMPVVLVIAVLFRQAADASEQRSRAVPWIPGFLLVFIGLVLLGSMHVIEAPWPERASQLSRALLVLAIAAAGMKTHFADLFKLGWLPLVMLLSETLWIALFIGLSRPWWT